MGKTKKDKRVTRTFISLNGAEWDAVQKLMKKEHLTLTTLSRRLLLMECEKAGIEIEDRG